MSATAPMFEKSYAKCIEVSKRVRWDMDKDVFRGREFSANEKYLPDGITEMERFDFLDGPERRFMSQVQGRTYANMFGFVERFITAKMLELTRLYWLDDQVALEALVRFCDEEIKHQSMFVRIEQMLSRTMPSDYVFRPDPNEVASAVLEKSTWAVLGVILEIELFTQEHYRASIATDLELSELYKDVFLFHWKEETTHAIMDELEWPRVHMALSPAERDTGVDDLIAIVSDFDAILQHQSNSDVNYFLRNVSRTFDEEEKRRLRQGVHGAYRRQYIFSGVEHPRYQEMLQKLATPAQLERLVGALQTMQ